MEWKLAGGPMVRADPQGPEIGLGLVCLPLFELLGSPEPLPCTRLSGSLERLTLRASATMLGSASAHAEAPMRKNQASPWFLSSQTRHPE
eukprot:1646825-Prymnesium_polylepis.1